MGQARDMRRYFATLAGVKGVPREKLGVRKGELSADDMTREEQAMLVVLGFAV